ncbi:Poly(RC)-binding protein 3 [Fasciola gigantica]|uniref:Poly(RC)-binding protein 3 n=1 Tax=Fasciola gigantica TaxID=46835 RepID=A0A504YAN5_FASGI|nr:Poly(RC)-binding protein 3 [Fasciola gigantica]
MRFSYSFQEVGTIIGKHGENIKNLRTQTGACVKITDGSSPERIITVSGSVQQVISAFECICQTFEEDHLRSTARLVESNGISGSPCPPITLRLLIQEHLCGSIIGKGGTKIRRIRELTGAHIQVAAQVLPNSSDRPITLSGSARSVALSIRQLCQIFVRLCFQNIGKTYQPQPTYVAQPSSRVIYRQDPILCNQLSCSSLPAISLEPLVIPVSTNHLFDNPSLAIPSYLDYAATFPITSSGALLCSPESVFSIPLLLPALIPSNTSTGTSSLTYSSIPLACQSALESKNNALSLTTSALMSNLHGNFHSTANAMTQGDSTHLPLNHPIIPRVEATGEARPTRLVPGTGLILSEQSRQSYDHLLTERPQLVHELEQLMNFSPALGSDTNAGISGRLLTDSKSASVADRVYQTLQMVTQTPYLLADPKTGLAMHQLTASPCAHTPDPLLSVPCPKTPCIRVAPQESQHKVEMFLPNDIVGCIIGRGGNKINEIRQMSQATIKISSGEDGVTERRITIIGTSAAIKTAQNMINSSIELHKHLVALNMAMNRFYASSPQKLSESSLRRVQNCSQTRSLREAPLSITGNPLDNQHGFVLPYYATSHNMSSAVTPDLASVSLMETHSAPAQLGVQGQSDSIVASNTPNLGGSRKSSAVQVTPYVATPFLSATRLENSKRGSNTMLNPIDLSVHQQKVLELIQQLPHLEQQKWLNAFGLSSTSLSSGSGDGCV